MNIVDELSQLKEKVDRLSGERNRALGKFEAAEEALKKSGFDTVEEAEKFVAKQLKDIEAAEAQLEQDIEEFKNEYSEYL